MPKGSGFITLTDLNDAILSGSAPKNPTVGTLWIDSSVNPNVLKTWNGTNWIPQSLSLENLDKDASDKIDKTQQDIEQLEKDLRLTGPLPTSLSFGTNGITASTSDSNKYARMDYRGFYAKGGAFAVERPDGAMLINNGIAQFDFAIDQHDPPFKDWDIHTEGWWYVTTSYDWQSINFYSYKHTGRYLRIHLAFAAEANGQGWIRIMDANGKTELAKMSHGHWIGNGGAEHIYMIDLGTPTFEIKGFYIHLASGVAGLKAYVRKVRAWMEG